VRTLRGIELALVVSIFLLSSSRVHADPATPKDWELQVLMYGWASAIDRALSASLPDSA